MNTKKHLLWMLCTLLSLAGLWAQNPVQITGSVLFSQEAIQVPGYPVWVINAEGIEFGGMTDDNGNFAITAIPSPNTNTLTAEVLDFCTGELLSQTVMLNPALTVYPVEPFHVCQDIMPPPPPTGCDAYFFAEELDPINPLNFQFHDLSYSELPITSWQWDFGDGSTSTEQNPQHAYDTLGGYLVTLTIASDSCTSTFETWINIGSGNCACPDVYDPVCVMVFDDIWQDTIILTFNNACEAECQGFSPDQFLECTNDCNCDLVYDPVCVYLSIDPIGLDSVLVTFNNSCEAECAGFTPDQFVDCGNDCNCDAVYDPVCVVSPDGSELHFTNACFAACAGFTPDQFVDCENDCNCPEIFDPVCVGGPNGGITQFDNACFAECAGYTPDQFVECDDDCICPDIYDPVCVYVSIDSIGLDSVLVTFTNPCEAACYGFTPDQFVDCGTTCNCDPVFDPVCVVGPDGSELHFINACYAACAGFTPEQFVDCGAGFDCYANFYADFPNPISLSVQFTDVSSGNNAPVVAWSWAFGDGGTSTEQNPTHTYAVDGIYEVTLSIVTADSCTSTTTQHICIGNGGGWEGPECQAMFYFIQDSSDLATFYFQDYSLGAVNSWLWNFGDGNTSSEQNPTHTYADPGIYIVTLTVNGENCENTMYMIVATDDNILYENTCAALYLPFIYPDELTVFLLNLSSPDAISYTWDYGDGTTSSDPFGFHQYAESGVYTITLTIVTASGCTNSFSSTINFEDGSFRGTPQYSIINETNEAALIESLKVAPNPASSQVNLMLELARNTGELNIQILSADGKVMTTRREGSASGKHLTTFDIADWAPGMYIARIQSGSEVRTLRFVKQ
ncbi:MAG: PKD domain-containing protein [Saprospiraceae bacterium]